MDSMHIEMLVIGCFALLTLCGIVVSDVRNVGKPADEDAYAEDDMSGWGHRRD